MAEGSDFVGRRRSLRIWRNACFVSAGQGVSSGGEHEGCQDGEDKRQVGTRWDHVFEASISEQWPPCFQRMKRVDRIMWMDAGRVEGREEVWRELRGAGVRGLLNIGSRKPERTHLRQNETVGQA